MSDVKTLGSAERVRLMSEWHGKAVRYRPDATVHGLFREVCAASPDSPALIWDQGQLNYRQLDRISDVLACRLADLGVGADSAVAICLPRSPEAIIAALAVFKAGGAYVPLDPEYPRARLEFVINDARIGVVITGPAGAGRCSGLAREILTLTPDILQSYASVPVNPPPESTSATGRAYVMYTSGSTGTPKGVQIEHRSIVRLIGAVDYVRLNAATRFLHAAPLGFDASTLELWGPLLHGGAVVICLEAIPTGRGIASLISAHGVNGAWLTAALFNAFVEDDPVRLRGLRQLLIGGEALSTSHIRRAQAALPETELINGYGPTECTTFTTTYSIPNPLPADAITVPIGRPIADTQVYVLDEQRELVPIGAEGELYIGGLGLARGYLGLPELDAERFVANPFDQDGRLYRSGDRVCWRADGVLEFLGRADQQVKIRGFRIELGEIEARLAELPEVKACAVLAREHADGKRLVAYVVPKNPGFAVSELRKRLGRLLPDFMVPAAFVGIDALPVTPNGKLDRAALPAPTSVRPELAQPYRSPNGAVEGAVCAVFADILGLDRVGALDGFFELGGNSLLVLRLLSRLRDAGLGDVTTTAVFAASSPAALARHLTSSLMSGDRVEKPLEHRREVGAAHEPIAIVGMAGRFPGARDIDAFWSNLCSGTESIRMFKPEELDPSIPTASKSDPAYVAARGVLDDVEQFDAGFFGITPLEAQLMDPQHRHFLEVSWHALEHAGYVPETAPGRIGIFGGMHNATYFQRHLLPRPDVTSRMGELQVMLGNEKDYVTSRVAHKLGFSGPAVSVNTACSTSLVAATMAMDSLRGGGSDIALAGGVAINCPPNSGYLYQEGSMASPDGHTRAFDANAAGTVFSDGVAVVVLRRLSDAIAAGDSIYAVLLGAAVNNDGSHRASFTAPSPEGQASVISAAHDAAGIDARSLSYIEAHGTATPLGDPIEIEGLTRAFRRHTNDRGFCAVGSLKSNVGHLVIAAGAAGLIKTALALHREALPPSIGFERPNPQIDFERTPFRVQTALAPWPRGEIRRRAGVSSFGFGGTNAHVVMEEAPVLPPDAPSSRPSQLLILSARSAEALDQAGKTLGARIEGLHLADVAHTLRVGRRAFSHRRYVVASSAADAARQLCAADASRNGARIIGEDVPEICFLCPGQGAQYAAMGRGLYATEPAFRSVYDECLGIIEGLTGSDPRLQFFSDDPAVMVPTSVTQPAIFCLEYSLARLWMNWGVQPRALIGHSVGEFACAAIAGVMTLADAISLVLERGRRMQALPPGAMLSVRLSASALESKLPKSVVIAAENAPGLCVVSGPYDGIAELETQLNAQEIPARRLVTSHAFHSPMMDPVIQPMADRMAVIELCAPSIPIMSTVTSEWLTDSQARDPRYWAEHLRRPVRFGPAVARLLGEPRRILVEIGPRATLSTLARQALPLSEKRARPPAIASLGDSSTGEPDAIAAAIGQLWTMGAEINWALYSQHEQRRRVALPGYPFQHQRYWVDAPAQTAVIAPAAAQPPAVAATAVAPAAVADPVPALVAPAGARRDRLLAKIRELIEDVSGIDVSGEDPASAWLVMGLDSLTLTQLALQLQRSFGIKITFRQVMEQYSSMARLVEMLDATLDPESAPASAQAAASAVAAPAAPAAATKPTTPALALTSNEEEPGAGPVTYDVKKAFGAIARIHTRADELTAQQRARLDALIFRYTKRTARSKAYTAEHRPHMADPRVVNGFRPLTKELTYQIVIERSRGSRMWDLDGNEYVDVLSGFGMSLFGWQPDFLREAIHRQVDLGYEIGPQHVLAGETAKLFCELTGADRAAFCNTGSEAVMGTMRIARTVTGRSLIAIFTGAYHGIFDEVIVRGTRKLKSIPAAPGIMPSASQNVLVLDYGTPESLQILRERAHELAAIVVEPVQSRRPDFQPVEFLRELRTLTESSGTLLVFDEVVTGFRAHPRGIQGLFGIQADLASYGKVVGGGFSIGVIAGKRAFMDALDGGHWEYGDESIPTVGVTYFAGTFVRHPLALAAAKATLQHLLESGPELQHRLTARTAAMVAEINDSMAKLGAPFKLNTFASLWRNVFTEELPYGDLIYVMLRDRGIHILDNFPCFLTTSHTDKDIRSIVRAYVDAAAEMQVAGFFPNRAPKVKVTTDAAGANRWEVASTEAQREVWLADRLGPESSLAYNESVSLHLRGELQVAELRQAVRELAVRHESLRATFSDDGTMLRIAETPPMLEIPLIELSADPANSMARLAEIAMRHVREPFNLENGPLVRAELLQLAPDHHVLILTAHHIIVDGWSFWVLVKDLAALYSRHIGARVTDLEAAPSFAQYAAELADRSESADSLANVNWWAGRFTDGGPALELPTDRPRPRFRTQNAGRHDCTLPAELVGRLKKIGAAQGASLFATLVAGFSGLLNRLTGQDDLVVGVPAAGQSAASLPGLVGHCVSMLPLRIAVDRSQSFNELLKSSRTVMLDAYDHQDVTFGRVLRGLPIARDTSRLPLISVIFNIDQALSSESVAMPGVHLELASNPRVFETFELFVNAVDNGAAGMRLECQYNSDLFDESTVVRWMAGFQLLLDAAASAPESALGRLPVVTPADLELLAEWNATSCEFRGSARVETLIASQIVGHPDRIAVRAGVEVLTYAQLGLRIGQVAAALRSAGVVRGDRVGLLMERDIHLLPALVGTLQAGACYVPLDAAFPVERLAFMIADAGLRAVLSTAVLADRFKAAIGSAPVVTIEQCAVVPGDSNAPLDGTSEDDAYVIYTSGSTGKPKGVCVPHRAVVNFLESMSRVPGIGANARVAAVTTVSFDIAVLELLLPLAVGAQVVLISRDAAGDGHALRGLLERHQIDVMQATPATWRLLLEAGWQGNARFKALCGGESMSPELAAALLPRTGELWNMYGPTETTVWSSVHRVERAEAPIPVGRPIANTALHVLDDQGNIVPIGVAGELYIGGTGVTRGYLGRPELNRERFVPDTAGARIGARNVPSCGRLYRTGDVARWRSSGVLECRGRTDFQVKVRGYRIELGEIEATIARHPAVSQAVVTAREDRPGDVRLVAYVIGRPNMAFEESALRSQMALTLPEHMLPQHIMTLAAMPLTPNGKVDRRALPAPVAVASMSAAVEPAVPMNPRQVQIARLFQEILAVPRVGIDDDFFVLGGHSLLAAQLAARLGRELECSVPMRTVFELPTVARLAAWADQERAIGAALQRIRPRADGAAVPLSLMQHRVWYVEQLQPGRTVFNVPSAHRLRGELDLEALSRSFAELVRRQPVLRTSIQLLDGEPVQVVAEMVDASIPFETLDGNSIGEREQTLARRLEVEVGTAFDLSQPPLFKIRLFRLDVNDHVLFFMPHHAIWDGWSFDLFYEEMAALYSAYLEKSAPQLPALQVDYADFSVWQRGSMRESELEKQLQHWREKLSGAPDTLELPLDKPRPPAQSGDGSTTWLRLPADTVAALRELSSRQGATLFMTLLSAWSLLLCRTTGQSEVVVGTPVRGRNLPELEPIMGFFVNALPLRLHVNPQSSFLELLRSVRQEVLESFGYQDVPFEHLVRVLNPPRDESRFPIYQAFFSYQDARQRPSAWGDLRHENLPVFQPSAAQDLALWFLDGADGVVGGLNFNTDILEAATAERLRDRYLALLNELAANPSISLRELGRVSAAELDQLNNWNSTAIPEPMARTIPAYLAPSLRGGGDKVAIRFGELTVSCAQLAERSARIGAALRSRGVVAGDIVGLHLDRSPDLICAMLGVLQSGAAYLPLDPGFPASRIEFMLSDANVRLLIHDAGPVPESIAGALLFDVRQVLAGPVAAEIANPAVDAGVASADRAAYVIYTSGSTGKPKGVCVPHGAVINFLESMKREPGLSPGARLAAVSTVSFDIAVLELLLPLAVGAEVVLVSRDDAIDGHALRRLIERTQATALQATPATWRLLLEAGWRGGPNFKALCGGEALPVDVAEALLERSGELWNMYGPTETTVWSTCMRIQAGQGDISIGRPIGNTQVWVLDPCGDLAPVGVAGELHIGGAGVALGYLNRRELTDERFIPDRFSKRNGGRLYRTGDLGRWRGDGVLQHLGRADFQVKIRGYRIELGEIEAALSRHERVEQAIVMAPAHDGVSARLVAFIVWRNGVEVPAPALREHLRDELPDYMIPAIFVPVERMPLTANGKVDRRALIVPKELDVSRAATPIGAPRSNSEILVADVWRLLLNVANIGAGDNFLDLGGHSLLIMRAVAAIEARSTVRISPRALVFQTLAQVAAEIDRASITRLPDEAPAATGYAPSGGRDGLLRRVLSAFKPGKRR